MSTTFDEYADEELWLLRDERESLRDQIADLKAQLADADFVVTKRLKAKESEIAALRAHNDQLAADAQSLLRQLDRTRKELSNAKEHVAKDVANSAGLQPDYKAARGDLSDNMATRAGQLTERLSAAERELRYYRREIARLQPENDQLRAANQVGQAQIEDLKERLEIAESPTVSHWPADRTPWTFAFKESDLKVVQEAIVHATGDVGDADRLAEFCAWWLRVKAHRQKECDAANKCGHAGLAYMVLEMDWVDVLTRYGRTGWIEATDLIETLARTTAIYDVPGVVKEWRGDEPWRLESRPSGLEKAN